MENIKVLSLFDGISTGYLALNRIGIDPEYIAYENDKYATKVSENNFGNKIKHKGDILNETDWEQYKDVDLLLAGFPCQDLSVAKLNRQDLNGEKSKLFYNLLEIFHIVRPKYFLFENVASMKNKVRDIISELVGVEPIMIDSALVSAQRRRRYYWTNIPNIEQPKEKGILLKDILENNTVDEKYFFSEAGYKYREKIKQVAKERKYGYSYDPIDEPYEQKCPCIGAYYHKGMNRARPFIVDRKYFFTEKSYECMNRQIERLKTKNYNFNYEPIQPPYNQKCRTIDANYHKGMTGTRPFITDPVITEIRMLTPIECERLQTLPDNYTAGISNTQRYKCLGNAWTCDVIAHILKHIPKRSENNAL